MELSMSVSHGQPGNRQHDLVAEYRKNLGNVDETRTRFNVVLVDVGVRKVYENLFSDALKEYNDKQRAKGHPERVIDDYLLHIRKGNQEKDEYEAVIQLGNRDTLPATDEGCRKLAEGVYTDFMAEFKKKFPNYAITEAVIHMDEATPHLHIKYVPWVDGQKRGLSTRNSMSRAIKAMGYGRIEDVNEALHKLLEDCAEKHGISRLDMDNHEPHLSVAKFKAKMANVEEYRYINDPDLLAVVDQQQKMIERQSEMLDAAIGELQKVAEGNLDPSRTRDLALTMKELAERLRTPINRMREAVTAIPDRWRDHVINPIQDWMRKPFAAPKQGFMPPLGKFSYYENPYAPPWTEWRYEDAHGTYVCIHVDERDGQFAAEAYIEGERDVRHVTYGATSEQAAANAHALLRGSVESDGIAIGAANVLKKTSPSSDPTSKAAKARSRSVSADKARFQGNMPAQKPGRARKR